MCLVYVPYSSKINHTLKDFLTMIRSILGETPKYFDVVSKSASYSFDQHPISFPVLVPLIYVDFLLIVFISHLALPASGGRSFLCLLDLQLTTLTLSNSLHSTTDSCQGTIKTKMSPFGGPEALLHQKLNRNLGVLKEEEWIYFWKN